MPSCMTLSGLGSSRERDKYFQHIQSELFVSQFTMAYLLFLADKRTNLKLPDDEQKTGHLTYVTYMHEYVKKFF